jgi:hypothetical protein
MRRGCNHGGERWRRSAAYRPCQEGVGVQAGLVASGMYSSISPGHEMIGKELEQQDREQSIES